MISIATRANVSHQDDPPATLYGPRATAATTDRLGDSVSETADRCNLSQKDLLYGIGSRNRVAARPVFLCVP